MTENNIWRNTRLGLGPCQDRRLGAPGLPHDVDL